MAVWFLAYTPRMPPGESVLSESDVRAILAKIVDPSVGKPTVVADPDGPVAQVYKRIARRAAVKIAESQKDMSSKFPNIVVQNT